MNQPVIHPSGSSPLYNTRLPEGTKPSRYGWIIDTDAYALGSNPASAAGSIGPLNIARAVVDILKDRTLNAGHHFKMYNADDELFYVGRIVVEPGLEWGEEFFAPLDDFGTGNGAVRIDYYHPETGRWEEL